MSECIDIYIDTTTKVPEDATEFDCELFERFMSGGPWVAHSEYMKLKDDNVKLRELVRDMWRFTGTACKKYPRLFDPAAQGGQTVQLNMIDAFEQRMRELGVEV